MAQPEPTKPSDVSQERTWLDNLADRVSNLLSKPPFFLVCAGFALVWAVTGPFLDFSHNWVDAFQLVTSLVTFMIVALLQNEGWRGAKATQRKLNALASALAELMEKSGVNDEEVRQLNAAVGLEKRESASR